MLSNHLTDTNVESYEPLPTPEQLRERLPLTERAWATVDTARKAIKAILEGKDSRKLCIVGPCSIHDSEQAQEYARQLAPVAAEVKDTFLVIMRAYFEKPRSTYGWKGLVNDPDLNGLADSAQGRLLARKLLLDLAELGLPAATETVSTRTIQCYDHLISYACIGARTTEAQTHRELASGLTMPVGFKNGTSGEVDIAVDAIVAARRPQRFDGMLPNGQEAFVHTKGNLYTHLILRGGKSGPNYFPEKVQEAQEKLRTRGLSPQLLVDCSHGNSNKNHEFQPVVFDNVVRQIRQGNQYIAGMMLESNLQPGRQPIPEDLKGFDRSTLAYGVSVTDACLGLEETVRLILEAQKLLRA